MVLEGQNVIMLKTIIMSSVQAGDTGTTDGDDGAGTHVDHAAMSEEAF